MINCIFFPSSSNEGTSIFSYMKNLTASEKNEVFVKLQLYQKKYFFNSYSDQKQFTRPKHDSVFQLYFTPQLLHIKIVKISAAHSSTEKVFCTTFSTKPLQTDKGKGI